MTPNALRCGFVVALITASAPAALLPSLPVIPTRVLATTSERDIMMNRPTPFAGVQLGGVHVDTSRTPNRFYVVDSANNRILGFYGYRAPRSDGTYPRADLVIGQPSLWDHAAANGDSSRYLPPTDRTLALIPFPYQVSTAEGGRSCSLASDAQGSLYVPDLNNNRILKFIDPFATDTIADDVWGQDSFTNRARLRPPNHSSLFLEWSEEQIFSAGVDVDSAGNLWVADCGNNRVLRFPPGSKAADLVLGQDSFTTWSPGDDLNQMRKPNAVRVHPVTGELYVLEGESVGTCRMLVFRPPFSTGMSAVRQFGLGQGGIPTSGLHWARGFALDPVDTSVVWVADGGNNRILQFNSLSGLMLDVVGFTNFTQSGDGRYQRYNGTAENLHQPDGDMGFDAAGNLYFTTTYMDGHLRQVPVPLRRNSQGLVRASGAMLTPGWNQRGPRTVQDAYGMAYCKGQLYCSAASFRMLVWSNVLSAGSFQPADFVLGQSGFSENQPGGTFAGYTIGAMSAGGDWLFVGASGAIFVFRTPILNGGRDYPPYKIIKNTDVVWDDDGTRAPFDVGGLAYDAANNALWVSDTPRCRVLRIRDPLGTTPAVDLVLGQTDKTDSAMNHGLGLNLPDANGFAVPWTLALDRYGNLYVVDGRFEGHGNMRATRFDAASLVPTPGTLFPFPAASGVFAKPTLTTSGAWHSTDDFQPDQPSCVAFDSQNRMVLLEDSYGNGQWHRAFLYPTPHVGSAPDPSHYIDTAFGQAAFAAFDERDNLIIQDHTWNRILFYTASSHAPFVNITNRTAMVSATAPNLVLCGTNSPGVVGTMVWRTSAGLAGTFPATTPWSITVPLANDEVTIINVEGTNSAGFLGSDALSVARPVLPAPVLVPPGGSYTSQVMVSLCNGAPNSEIRFTSDGSEPTAKSCLYTQPIAVTSNLCIQARTFQAGVPSSELTQGFFDLYLAAPVVSPAGGVITGIVFVTMHCDTIGAQIRYTLDGREPSRADRLYTGTLLLDAPALVKAKSFMAGTHESATVVAAFTNSSPAVPTPAIVPPGGMLMGRVDVTLICSNAEAEIRFTTDGSEPNQYSSIYGGPITLTNGTTVKTRAYAPGLVPSFEATAVFSLLEPWRGIALPDASLRNSHTALGSDGTNLYFTRGYESSVPFFRIAKGTVSGWVSLAPLPIPWSMSGVGNLCYFDGALWTLAPRTLGSSIRCVYRYSILTDTWDIGGAAVDNDGPDTAIAVVATNRIYAGWNGWDRIKNITNWQAGLSTDVESLSGGAAGCWDSCAGPEFVYFLKHHFSASNSGVLGLVNKVGAPAVREIAGMPFNPGWGDAIEYLPGGLFPDGRDRLYLLRGTTGTIDGDGNGWSFPATTNQLAIFELTAQTWSLESLPFSLDEGSEMCLVGDTLYILAANSDPQPLKMARFLPLAGAAALPHIAISQQDGIAHMTWDNSGRGFMLEQTASLGSSASWTFLAAGTNEYHFGISTNDRALFFRLRLP